MMILVATLETNLALLVMVEARKQKDAHESPAPQRAALPEGEGVVVQAKADKPKRGRWWKQLLAWLVSAKGQLFDD